MSLKLVVYGDKLDLADELEESFRKDAKAVVGQGGSMFLAEVQRLLRLRVGTEATTAPPGAPPEYDAGELAASFRRIPPSVRGRVVSSGISSTHEGANRLEFGKTDRRGIRTLPHPYVAPALAAIRPAVTQLFNERL